MTNKPDITAALARDADGLAGALRVLLDQIGSYPGVVLPQEITGLCELRLTVHAAIQAMWDWEGTR